MTITKYLDDFYFPFRPSLSPRTKKLYRYTVRKFGQWLGHRPTIADLNNTTVGKYISALMEADYAPSSVDKERRQLVAIWRDAMIEGIVRKGPRIRPVKIPDPIPRALNVIELKQLWLAFGKLQGSTGGNANEHVIRAAATIQLNTAERIGAVSKLQWNDIVGRVITFRAETRKGGRRAKVAEVPDIAIDYLGRLHRESNFVFPGCPETIKLNTLYTRAFERSGIAYTPGKTSHLLRSTKATVVDSRGGNAARSLGNTPAVCEKHYIQQGVDDSWKLLDWVG